MEEALLKYKEYVAKSPHCISCRFFTPGGFSGTCHRRAPTVTISELEWCGDHELVEETKTEERIKQSVRYQIFTRMIEREEAKEMLKPVILPPLLCSVLLLGAFILLITAIILL